MTAKNHKLHKAIVLYGLLGCIPGVVHSQSGPFTGEAVIDLGGDQSVQTQTQVTVPVNIDLSSLSATDAGLSSVPAALGQYRFVISYDASLLQPQINNNELPGGSASLFSAPIPVNEVVNGNQGRLIFQASQLNYGTPTGLVHVADIPFLVTGEAGATADLQLNALDLRTTMDVQAGPPVSLFGGAMMPFSIQTGHILITPGGLLAYDSDGDGIADSWELAHGLNPNLATDAAIDGDGDGFSALQEYLAGSAEGDAGSVPPGVVASQLSYLLFNDDFNDSQYTDRWYVADESVQAIYSLNETTDQLTASLQQPASACHNIKLLSLGAFDADNGVMQGRVSITNGGVLKIGLQHDEDVSNRIELHLDRNQQQALLQIWTNDVSSDQVIALAGGTLDNAVLVRLLKTGSDYRLYLNHVEVAQFSQANIGNSTLRLYQEILSCASDSAAVGVNLDYLRVLRDTDGDGLADSREDPNFNGVMDSGETSTLVADDSDGDSRLDGFDNCIGVANLDQLDSDGDGFGQLCDGDLNNDGRTNTLDLNLYRIAHRTVLGDANYNVDADFTGDGRINTLDLNIYRQLHRLPPGPSCCDAE